MCEYRESLRVSRREEVASGRLRGPVERTGPWSRVHTRRTSPPVSRIESYWTKGQPSTYGVERGDLGLTESRRQKSGPVCTLGGSWLHCHKGLEVSTITVHWSYLWVSTSSVRTWRVWERRVRDGSASHP